MRHDDKRLSGKSEALKCGRRGAGFLILLPALGVLAACASAPTAEAPVAPPTAAPATVAAPETPIVAAPAVLTPTPNVATRERFPLAINLLNQGNPQQANVELKAYLAEIPNSPQVRFLVAQIETPIAMLYPAENFTVQLGREQTLSALAQIYLGNAQAFYGLARYNAIEVPARVLEGQTIKIPSTAEALAARDRIAQGGPALPGAQTAPAAPLPGQAAAAPRRDPWAIIRTEVAAGRYDAAVREAETSRVTPDRMQAVILASAYAGSARTIRATNAPLAGTLALRAGELYLETADRPEEALEPLQMALAITPNNARAQTLLASAKTKASEIHYRTGLTAFQRQDLDAAIAAWDKALAIDPAHRNAQLQRAQAIELKANLQRLR